MDPLLGTCLLILFAGAIIVIVGLSADSGPLFGFGLAVVVLDLIFGLLMLCNLEVRREETAILQPTEFARSPFTVYVKYEDQQLSSTEARIVFASNDLIRVKKTVGFNSYGSECSVGYQIVVMDGGK